MSGYIKKKDVLPVLESYWVLWYECDDEYNNIYLSETGVVKGNRWITVQSVYPSEFTYTDETKQFVENSEGITLYDNRADALVDYLSLIKTNKARHEDEIKHRQQVVASLTDMEDKYAEELKRYTNIEKLTEKI